MASSRPKISISASTAASFCGLHKYATEEEGLEKVLASNAWLKPTTKVKRSEILTEEGKKLVEENKEVISLLIESPSIPTVKSVPVPDEVLSFASSIGFVPDITKDLTTLRTPVTEQQENDHIHIAEVVLKYFEDVQKAVQVKKEEVEQLKVASSAPIPNCIPDDVARHIIIERGNTAEVPALQRFKVPDRPDLLVQDKDRNGRQKMVRGKHKSFSIVGMLDAAIYDDKHQIVGLVEAKNRKNAVFTLERMLKKDRDGVDMAYDLRQMACYWSCMPDKEFYYLLQIHKGELHPLRIETELLKSLWEEMEPILEKKCSDLLDEWDALVIDE